MTQCLQLRQGVKGQSLESQAATGLMGHSKEPGHEPEDDACKDLCVGVTPPVCLLGEGHSEV